MTPSRLLNVQRVHYYAVYPDGRRVSVTPEDIAEYGDTWQEKDGLQIETLVSWESVAIFGTVNYV